MVMAAISDRVAENASQKAFALPGPSCKTSLAAMRGRVKAHLDTDMAGFGQLPVNAPANALEVAAVFHGVTSSNTVPITSLYAPPSSMSNQHSVSMLGFGPLKWTI